MPLSAGAGLEREKMHTNRLQLMMAMLVLMPVREAGATLKALWLWCGMGATVAMAVSSIAPGGEVCREGWQSAYSLFHVLKVFEECTYECAVLHLMVWITIALPTMLCVCSFVGSVLGIVVGDSNYETPKTVLIAERGFSATVINFVEQTIKAIFSLIKLFND